MIYANLVNVRAGKTPLLARAAIRLTSSQLKGSIKSDAGSALIEKFFAGNNFALKDREFFRQFFTRRGKTNSRLFLSAPKQLNSGLGHLRLKPFEGKQKL
jgi:hypothetical protein